MDKLLNLISDNARLSNAELAIMTGKEEQEVAAQIASWEASGIIRGYKPIIDWDKTQRNFVTARIELRVTPRPDLGFDGIAKTIMKFEEVETVYLMSGNYDIAVTVSGHTFKDVAMFVAKRLSTLESVVSTATSFVLKRYKVDGVKLFGEEKDERGAL